MKSKTYTQNKQPSDKSQISKFCQLGVKQTCFQNLKEKKGNHFLIIVPLLKISVLSVSPSQPHGIFWNLCQQQNKCCQCNQTLKPVLNEHNMEADQLTIYKRIWGWIRGLQEKQPVISTAVASDRPTEALASVISFTFVVYSHY